MNDWFEWNGVRCTDYGMHVLSLPSIVRAEERVNYTEIPGVHGSPAFSRELNIYNDMVLACACIIDDPYEIVEGTTEDRIGKICGWLTGSGNITFANRPEGFYKGRVTSQISFDKIVMGNPHMSFQIQFRVKPFFYLNSGLIPVTLTASSNTLLNLGNFEATPLLKIVGTGEGTIMCGPYSTIIDSMAGLSYLMIDAEAKMAYTGALGDPLDPLVLLGTRVIGDWPKIPTGSSFLTISGAISSIQLTPRWRNIG